jgi:formylglycine-generating enzyme required for sulfatase activity
MSRLRLLDLFPILPSMLRPVIASFALLTSGWSLQAEAPGPPKLGQNFNPSHPAIPLLWVEPGTFYISGTLSQGDDTVVTLTRGYWLGRTEITQAQWQAIMDSFPNPSRFKGSDRPVETVSWNEVNRYIIRLNQREQAANRLPEGYEYALPTEAQWEYAARAGSEGNYAGDLESMDWFDANSGGETHPVAQKSPNAWGFHDMMGNVREWCADWYGGYPGGQVSDPTGPTTGQFRVIRGGSWEHKKGTCRIASREWWKPALRHPSLGFRLALVPRR